MNKAELSQALKYYKAGKLNWLELGHLFKQASEESIPVDGNLISKSRFNEINRSYNFIMENGLENDPRIFKVPIRAIAYLPFIRTLLDDQNFKRILNEVLKGEVNGNDMEKLSRDLQGKNSKKFDNFKNLKARIVKLTEDLSDDRRYPEMRKHMSRECSELAQRLNCIIDEKYYKLWLEREEFEI